MKPFLTRFLTLGAATASLVLLSSGISHATNLAEYDFTGYATSDAGSAVTTTAGMLAASNFAPNSAGFQAFAANSTAGNYMFTTNGNSAFGYQSVTNPATEALSVTDGTYYNFTLTPTAISALSFNKAGGVNTLTLDFNPRVLNGSTAPFTSSLSLRSSVDNFATTIGTFTGTQATTNGNTLFPALSVDLTSLGTLAAGQAITFRLYAYDAPGDSNHDVKVDNVIVNGTLAVPEPGTYAMLGLGALGLLVFARRRACA